MNRTTFVNNLLARTDSTPGTYGEAFAPSNIALCKYWGKRNVDLNLPVNSSLSVSLKDLGTKTRVSICEGADRITFNEESAPNAFAGRLSRYLDLFRGDGLYFDVQTENNIPTAAGLASSASGFAALIRALDKLMGWSFNDRELSMLARLGSGSAARSLYYGFAVWHAGDRSDGMDSYAEAVPTIWSDFRLGILEVSDAQKETGSTDGMNRTTETSQLYQSWSRQASCDFDTLRTAIIAEDFPLLGKTAENNALTMHATMISAWPPLCYWKPESLALMHRVWAARQDGLEVYFTMDAGPNLKLLFLASSEAQVKALFPDVQVVSPFE